MMDEELKDYLIELSIHFIVFRCVGSNRADDAAAERAEGSWNRTSHFFAAKAGPADAW